MCSFISPTYMLRVSQALCQLLGLPDLTPSVAFTSWNRFYS